MAFHPQWLESEGLGTTGDRAATGMPRPSQGTCTVGHPLLQGRIFLRKHCFALRSHHSRYRLWRIPSCKAAVAPEAGWFRGFLMQALGLPVSAGAGHDAVAEGDGNSRKQENKMDAGFRHYRLFIVRACIDESF